MAKTSATCAVSTRVLRRTLFRIAHEVEQMAEQKQEARRCTGQPASGPEEVQ